MILSGIRVSQQDPGLYFLAQADQGGYPFIGVYRCDRVFKSKEDIFNFDKTSNKIARDQLIEWNSVERMKLVWFCVDRSSSFGEAPQAGTTEYPWNASHWMRVSYPEYPVAKDFENFFENKIQEGE